MKERFELYEKASLRLVDVRKYNGVEDGMQSWTFLGYDVVKVLENGDAVSILAKDEIGYKFLKPISDEKDCPFFDHSGINLGDIRIKVIDNTQDDVLGNKPFVSSRRIKKWIDNNTQFYFLNYQYKENAKVKKLGEMK